ncbi:hypothetical protein CXF93_08530 [Moritella sp. Urea-trap-13]|nr:hypothetical protein CXF93_08530 [Moritella sp. Urea-trap-13]
MFEELKKTVLSPFLLSCYVTMCDAKSILLITSKYIISLSKTFEYINFQSQYKSDCFLQIEFREIAKPMVIGAAMNHIVYGHYLELFCTTSQKNYVPLGF